jgi:hypothetical protein
MNLSFGTTRSITRNAIAILIEPRPSTLSLCRKPAPCPQPSSKKEEDKDATNTCRRQSAEQATRFANAHPDVHVVSKHNCSEGNE